MKKYILLCSLSVLFLNCSGYKKSEFETWVEKEFKSKCGDSDGCSLDIKKFKNLKWDKLYVFSSSASLEEVNKMIGFEYPFYIEPGERVVFVRNNKVVYHDDYCQTFDDDVYKTLLFDLGGNHNNHVFSSESAIFKVRKIKDYRNQIYYVFSR
ncbi:MAG: hypothetical protein J0M25_13865 [Flavobacteriales bacterium]|nr:hypothetical protein [Flavobacteriales bacterium]